MEEKYRKLAVELGIKVVEDKAVEDNRWQEKYYQREISRLELQTKMLIKTICDQREYIDTLEDIKNEYDSKVIELRKEIVKRDEEIETLKKIIDKCNTTYYNANAKTQVVLDGTVKAVEECIKQRNKKDGNDWYLFNVVNMES